LSVGSITTVTGAVLAPDRFDTPNNAFHFEGVGDHIISDVPELPNGAQHRTFSVWFKTGFRDPSLVSIGGLGILNSGSAENGRRFGLDLLQSNGHVYFVIQGPGPNLDSGVVVDNDAWHQAVISYGSSGVALYIDGALTTSSAASLNTAVAPLVIGAIPTSHSGFDRLHFRGSIDDIRIYNRALSSAEVSNLYAIESQPPVPRRATAELQVVNGFVVGLRVIDPGYGYTEPPSVLIRGGNGAGASATATVEGGIVTGFSITSPGSGFTGTPSVLIASPPFSPRLSIKVNQVSVTLKVVLGRRYQLEASENLSTWIPVGGPFVAEDEEIVQDFLVSQTGQNFRIRQLP
jgi:hypothetical protein